MFLQWSCLVKNPAMLGVQCQGCSCLASRDAYLQSWRARTKLPLLVLLLVKARQQHGTRTRACQCYNNYSNNLLSVPTGCPAATGHCTVLLLLQPGSVQDTCVLVCGVWQPTFSPANCCRRTVFPEP